MARRGRRVTATIIDGREIARQVREEVAREVAELVAAGGPPPGLATILVGADPASEIYVAGKQKASREVGIEPFDHRPPADASHEDVAALIAELNADPAVSGILLQLPVPDHLDGPALTALIDPAKDVDGLTPINAGHLAQGQPGLRPCTPHGGDRAARPPRRRARGGRGGRRRAARSSSGARSRCSCSSATPR